MNVLTSRRRFLMGLAAAGVVLPLSSSGLVRMALAGEKQQAKLKVVFFVVPDGLAVDSINGYGSGDGRGLWHPTVTAGLVDSAEFHLSAVSQELEAYREQSLYVRGIVAGFGNGGHAGWKDILRDKGQSMSSIDVLLGDHMPGTSQRAVFAGPHAGIDGYPWFVSWKDGSIRTPERNPVLLYESLFGITSSAVREQQVRSKHAFDPMLADIQDIKGMLAGAQRQKLDTHLDSVEQVIADLDDSLPPITECQTLSLEDHPITSALCRNEVQHAHSQVVATALSCGITRVATIQVGRSGESLNILEVSNTTNPHDCAHRYATEEVWRGSRQWYARKVKEFMDELARFSDPDVPTDSLLKHTLVVVTSEMADGAPEHRVDMPLLLMGGASGLLKNGAGKGRYLNVTAQADEKPALGGNPVMGEYFVGMQRIWATIAAAAGTTVPYGGNVNPVTGIFTNV